MFAFASSFVAPLTARPHAAIASRRPARAPAPARGAQAARMVISTEDETGLRITGNNIRITEALREHVKDNLSKVVKKYGSMITKVDVFLTVEHNAAIPDKHKAEVVVFAGKQILRSEVRDPDMYAAIDRVEERINRTLRKYKERRINRSRKQKGSDSPSGAAVVPDDEDEDDDGMEDTYGQSGAALVPPVTEVVKRKVFPMPLQSVEEAVLCTEYIDHPWYLFRNEATNEIALVYKRKNGGYGLIEPSNPDAKEDD